MARGSFRVNLRRFLANGFLGGCEMHGTAGSSAIVSRETEPVEGAVRVRLAGFWGIHRLFGGRLRRRYQQDERRIPAGLVWCGVWGVACRVDRQQQRMAQMRRMTQRTRIKRGDPVVLAVSALVCVSCSICDTLRDRLFEWFVL